MKSNTTSATVRRARRDAEHIFEANARSAWLKFEWLDEFVPDFRALVQQPTAGAGAPQQDLTQGSDISQRPTQPKADASQNQDSSHYDANTPQQHSVAEGNDGKKPAQKLARPRPRRTVAWDDQQRPSKEVLMAHDEEEHDEVGITAKGTSVPTILYTM